MCAQSLASAEPDLSGAAPGVAKLNAVNPQTWLTDVLSRIADHKINLIDELLPWRYAAAAA
jgi:hypothetical protein